MQSALREVVGAGPISANSALFVGSGARPTSFSRLGLGNPDLEISANSFGKQAMAVPASSLSPLAVSLGELFGAPFSLPESRNHH